MHSIDFVSLSFKSQVRQVFPSINPVPDRPLDTKNYWNQNFLNHFRVHNSLWISQDLLDRRIHFRPFGFYQFKGAFCPILNLFNLAAVLQLVNLLLHFQVLISLNLEKPPGSLNLESSFSPHSLDCPPEILNFKQVSDKNKSEDLSLSEIILNLPEVFQNEIHV